MSPSRPLPISTTTPLGYPSRTPGSVGQQTPGRSSKPLSPHAKRAPRSTSPNYFEFVTDPSSNPPNSNAGIHTRKNWSPQADGTTPITSAPQQNYSLESQPRFENFRRQSETKTFNLSHGSLSHFSGNVGSAQSSTLENVPDQSHQRRNPLLPRPQPTPSGVGTAVVNQEGMNIGERSPTDVRLPLLKASDLQEPSFFDVPRMQSPANVSTPDLSNVQRTRISHVDERDSRNSLPHNRVEPLAHTIQRSETLPSSVSYDGPTMIAPQDFVDLLKGHLPQDLLVLDLRVFPQYSKSRISGAINLCIPTTLLKRPSFNVQKLSETFTKEKERAKFAQWRDAKFIILYDASSIQLKDATSSISILKKFTNEKWRGAALVIRGGYGNFAKKFPDQVDDRLASEMDGSNTKKLSIDPPGAAPVAGGCMMPITHTAANPFFGNIRQNMDLIGGVGQMPVKLPAGLKETAIAGLPAWLRQAANEDDKGKAVADRFLDIEQAEQHRMQKALSCNVSYGTPNVLSPEVVQIAGIEKGTKNRYKDMLPYDHSRVRLQNVLSGDCDYVNASHIKAQRSNKHYIASQAPVPATFHDFWRVVWEQDARVVVMLTAETEGGQRKCHPYWLTGDYGPFKLKSLSERHLPLASPKKTPGRVFSSPLNMEAKERPVMSRRRSTNYSAQNSPIPHTVDADIPHVVVRKLTLSHTGHPFESLREITQLQYSSWPDFGAPAHPTHVLGLVEHCNSVVRSYESSSPSREPDEPARKGERPTVVHCSAGCGRTGTFCTVDSVVDELKWQRQARLQKQKTSNPDDMDVDSNEEDMWMLKDDEDLVAKTVSDFRLQRLSMVQTLRQFVLCYETILEWIVGEKAEEYKGSGTDMERN
ncbi:MAG: hypothetical protein ASARMPRED_006555 [Alectoria sarmentosa]|nr:MAG: hypothetical protein ASARMPRED_006555 [Alectoria sarmentosa]